MTGLEKVQSGFVESGKIHGVSKDANGAVICDFDHPVLGRMNFLIEKGEAEDFGAALFEKVMSDKDLKASLS